MKPRRSRVDWYLPERTVESVTPVPWASERLGAVRSGGRGAESNVIRLADFLGLKRKGSA
jgi:hypothetical protein